jgi:hypothetical protein
MMMLESSGSSIFTFMSSMAFPSRDNYAAVEKGFHDVYWPSGSSLIIICENQND